MDNRWYKGCKPEDKEARTKELKSYMNAFEELSVLLEKEFVHEDGPDYDNGNWAYKQADRKGHNRAIRRILKLINLKDD